MDRRVTRTDKDQDGDIIRLCNPGQSWSPVKKADAISEIESGRHTYYVEEVAPRVNVRVVNAGVSKHLRTTADKTSKNNLDNLQKC